jgi:serine/threonine protein kinase
VSPTQGDVLAGRYLLTESIATGGMGEVWKAHDQTLDRDVAVKVLRPDSAEDEAFAERFRAEARHSGGLSHPNIGTVHDFGEDDGTAFLVMELLSGEPLSALIRSRAPMPQDEVVEILYQAAIALQAAHDAGVVHRDVKPANIVVDDDGYAKLTDFGIARALSEAPMTQTGEVLGTPHYLAPEQAQGRPAGPLSDVYALAVVGYEMLTGQRPFNGESMVTTALAHISQPAPQLSDEVGEPLRTTVMAALAKDPSQRPSSAGAFAEALRLPAGQVPEHLVAGARSAVTPVIAGVPADLAGDQTLPTSVFIAPQPEGAGGDTGSLGETVERHDTRRPAWMLPVAGAVVVLALVAVLLFANRGSAAGSSTPSPTRPVATTTSAPTSATATRKPATRTTTARPASTTAKPVASAPVASASAAKPAPLHHHGSKGKGRKGGKP